MASESGCYAKICFGSHRRGASATNQILRSVSATSSPEDQTHACELSIVMPCLDEAETVGVCVAKARRFLEEHEIAGEVVVADNGSTDGSREIARQAGARLITVEERGYGAALSAGFRAARGRFVIMGDSDDSYDFSALMPFVEELRRGNDLVMGNRFRGGIMPGAMPVSHRFLGNPVLSMLGRLFFSAPCRDFHCGLRGFRREAIEGLDLRTTGMEFASEMVVKAALRGLAITEVPATLAPAGRSRAPHLRTWRDGWRHLRFLLLFSPRWLFLYPGLALIAIGIGVGAWLLPGPRTVGGVTFNVHTLLYAAAAVLIGYQSVVFAVLTKVFAIDAGLLPEDVRVRRFERRISLELGLVIGFVLFVLGVFGTVVAVGEWGELAFGILDPSRVLRIVVPSILALMLGLQTMLASFFLSILELPRSRESRRRQSGRSATSVQL